MRHVLLGSVLFLSACGGSGEQTTAAEPVADAPVVEAEGKDPAQAQDENASKEGMASVDEGALAKADSMDGAEDKVVAKCGLCALHMDGDAAHAVTAGDYTLHMCSSACKESWEKDPAGSMAKLAEAAK